MKNNALGVTPLAGNIGLLYSSKGSRAILQCLNERKGTATALNQHNVYQHTLYAPAFNVGRLNERKGTIATQAAQIEDLAQSIDKATNKIDPPS